MDGDPRSGRESTSLAAYPPAASPAPLIAVLGPTASGKSALAIALALRFGGEVIACDSTQVYRGFDIGTAKPTVEERRGTPHHMMDIVDPPEVFTAGEYRSRVLNVLADLRQRTRLPIFTVGTGLYFRALLEGLADAPARSNHLRSRLRKSAATHGKAHLYRMLRRLDAAAAARISPNDHQKLIRTLEICLLTGKPLTDVHGAGRERLAGYAPLKIGLHPPRAMLYDRIETRVAAMLERGWRDEVAQAVRRGASGSKVFEFLGYKEIVALMEQRQPLNETIAAIAQATRRYAKRQFTWFRKETDVLWFTGFGDDRAVVDAASHATEEHLRRLRCMEPPSGIRG